MDRKRSLLQEFILSTLLHKRIEITETESLIKDFAYLVCLYGISKNGIRTDASYTYNANGCLATKNDGTDSYEYTYDNNNRLVEVKKNGISIQRNYYDGLGRRYRKEKQNETIEYYYGAGGQLVMDEKKGVITTYEGPWFTQNGQKYFPAYDNRGSVLKVLDSAGAVVVEYVYSDWGELIGNTNPSFDCRFKFCGCEYDEETGLYYMGARFYDATIGRFISCDPIGALGGLNLYSYCNNNPVCFTDPSGLAGQMNNYNFGNGYILREVPRIVPNYLEMPESLIGDLENFHCLEEWTDAWQEEQIEKSNEMILTGIIQLGYNIRNLVTKGNFFWDKNKADAVNNLLRKDYSDMLNKKLEISYKNDGKLSKSEIDDAFKKANLFFKFRKYNIGMYEVASPSLYGAAAQDAYLLHSGFWVYAEPAWAQWVNAVIGANTIGSPQ